jgi:hypothetical protein
MDATCAAKCDAAAAARAVCTPAQISVVIAGAAAPSAQRRAALSANLPKILVVAQGMSQELSSVSSDAQTFAAAFDAVRASVPAANAASFAACVGAPFATLTDSAASLVEARSAAITVAARASQ